MATAAPIEANRLNAQLSTCPKTEAGRATAKLNAMKHGQRARTAAPVLPQEDPKELDAKIRRWVEDLPPGTTPSATWWRGPPGSPGRSTASSGARPPGWP